MPPLQRSHSDHYRNAPGSIKLASALPPAACENAVDHIPTTATHASARSRSRSPSKVSSLEHYVGQQVAGAASALALALGEFQDGGLTSSTKAQGGDLIAELYRLRAFMVGYWDFDKIAREHGAAALRAGCDGEMSPATADKLVSAVLDILARVVRAAAN